MSTYRGTELFKYYQSFSGTDTLAFIVLPGCGPVFIGSLTTISYSMYRNKKPVINIGRTNINGVTRGSRIYAGTMIFTLINQHWLRELQTKPEAKWLADFEDLKTDDMPLFDIMIISANEYGNCVSMYIWGVDITDEAQTISVEDLFTENTFSFIARDISVFKKEDVFKSRTKHKSQVIKSDKQSNRCFVLYTSNISIDELGMLEKEYHDKEMQVINNKNENKYKTLSRDLYLSSSNTMMGNDVAEIQQLLLKDYDYVEVTGIFDTKTDKAVRNFQSLNGIFPDGVVNNHTYVALLNTTIKDPKNRVGVVINKYGAFVYSSPSIDANIVNTEPYQSQVKIKSLIPGYDNNNYYKTHTGYILKQDLYSAYNEKDIVEFPIIQYGNETYYVTMIHNMLSEIYDDFTSTSKKYDDTTERYIKRFQSENGLQETGIVNYQTWLLLQSASENKNELVDDNFKIEFNVLPGIYDLTGNILDYISNFYSKLSCNNYINVKYSTVAIYKNDESKVFTNTIPIKDETKLVPNSNAFLYNPEIGDTPKQVDFIIYPYNKQAYKWTIRL